MSLPCSFPLSISQVTTELGRVSGPTSLSETAVRSLAEVPSGPISMSQLLCKSSYSATWTGSSAAGVALFQTSVTMARQYFTHTGSAGAWMTAYTNGTFSSTTSQAQHAYVSLAGGFYFYAGFQTSGNLLRAVSTINTSSTYGAWMSFDKVTKWAGVTSADNHGYEASGGYFRAANFYDGSRGAWINLN